MPGTRDHVVFFLNGKRREASGPDAFATLAEYLRYTARLTGTKVVCAEGDCGACTVLRAIALPKKPLRFEAINSCIVLVAQLDGCHLVSVEGLKHAQELSPAQEGMVSSHGSQCGYCTPGFVVAMTWMLDRHKDIDAKTAKNHLTGNLCRCTGYTPIIDAAIAAARLRDERKTLSLAEQFAPARVRKELAAIMKVPLVIDSELGSFAAPRSIAELVRYRRRHPDALVIGAATDLGVMRNKGKQQLDHLLSLQAIPELYELRISRTTVRAGARVSLADLRRALGPRSRGIDDLLNLFASPQIKNAATLVGNVANASPIADTIPVLLALNARLEVLSAKGTRRQIPLQRFYLAYRKTALKRGEVILSIEFDLPHKPREHLRFYKVSQRKDLDISCVNAAVWAQIDRKATWSDVRIAWGGVAATPLRLTRTEACLRGRAPNEQLVEQAVTTLHEEIAPLSDLRGSGAYRHVVSENILRQLLHDIASA